MSDRNTNENFNPALFKINLGEHRGKKVIWLGFEYDKRLIQMIKEGSQAKWSQSKKCWYLADNRHNRILCKIQQDSVKERITHHIAEINRIEFEQYKNQLELKAYSPNTIRTYCIEFARLLYELKGFPVLNLTPERLKSYFLFCVKHQNISENHLHSRINAIKFYFEQVLHRDRMFFDIPRPKTPKLLPKTLNQNEILRLFDATINQKHKLMLKLCYGMGLRVSEIVGLKLEDIDTFKNVVAIRRGKGKKDRIVHLPEAVKDELNKYTVDYEPSEYLFEGQNGGQYSTRSAQQVFKNAMKKAGINKKIGIHGLRHSYATHLLEMGTDISLIQKLLGHNNIKTTLIYTEITDNSLTNIKSPLDNL
ncbi:MAG: tyrosine-type recombinase/integrase [Weeksellaceae bacterium]